MNNYETLKKIFIEKLNGDIESIKVKANDLKAMGSNDESKLERIKLNVVDIFQKMFILSYNNVYVKMNNQNLKSIIESDLSDYDKLRDCYDYFFNTIPKPWKISLQKCKEFDCVEKGLIEELKLAEAQRIQDTFHKLHKEHA